MVIRNIHRPPRAPESAAGAVLVRGSYDFYHFGCQGLDDRVWGCAYCSLQTIASWALQPGEPLGPPLEVAAHLKVQEALEHCGDKPAGFVGLCEWIGSFETGLALDSLFGLQCRILPFNCEAELLRAGGKLSQHFTRSAGL